MDSALPSPVSTGSDHYYRDRLADFQRRAPDSTAPPYYMEYGDKCLHQFRRTEPDLTAEGKRWLERTKVDLQDRMEAHRASDPTAVARLEHDGAAFEKVAFEMHSDAYLSSGVAELPVEDLWKILRTPDASDLLTAEGVKEILEVVDGVIDDNGPGGPLRWLKQLWSRVPTAYRRLMRG